MSFLGSGRFTGGNHESGETVHPVGSVLQLKFEMYRPHFDNDRYLLLEPKSKNKVFQSLKKDLTGEIVGCEGRITSVRGPAAVAQVE